MNPYIDWQHPPPENALDRFIGPGATRAEVVLQLLPTVLIALAFTVYAAQAGWGWSLWQHLLAAVLVLDMVGGVVTNATSAAKRWYHRPGQGFAAHMGFVALHVVQPALVVVFFDPGNWAFVAAGFGFVFVAALLVLRAPLYLQRPLAGLLLVLGIFLAMYGVQAPPGFEWFLPVYYAKLLCSHLLREEPYRPSAA
jgi:hypothetical protein